MQIASLILTLLFAAARIDAAAVFAHFMVGNTAEYGVDDWEEHMRLAQSLHVDAFALNMAYGWPDNDAAVSLAFAAAQNTGFRLFFSFDYAGNGPWPADVVTSMLAQYGSNSAYWLRNEQPLASTFEGPGNADDWVQIKQDTGCFFIPNWSSLGAGPAIEAGGGVADGLFSWAAWPYGSDNMTTYVDASYLQALNGKPYMMPVSPWFYTNLPGYDKNWAWNGDGLWYDRWQQAAYLQPEYIEIITWNDYGESHYITNPTKNEQNESFTIGQAPIDYVSRYPHDAWQTHLPYLIDTYKGLQPEIGEESIVGWFRLSPSGACSDGGTTGNTASQLQIEQEPSAILQDKLYFAALLSSTAGLLFDNGIELEIWDSTPASGVGIYRISVDMSNFDEENEGVAFKLQRRGASEPFISFLTTQTIRPSCPGGITNWNAFTISASSGVSDSSTAPPLDQQVCVAGWGKGPFNTLCSFTCGYGYCPVGACVCTSMGLPNEPPKATGQPGFPANGDANYAGLCSFACNLGFCPSESCSASEQPPFVPTVSPFADPACTAGEGSGGFAGLCSFSCNWGFCPIHLCACTSTGNLNVPPAPGTDNGFSRIGDDAGLCQFSCSHGYCPPDVCSDFFWPVSDELGYAFAAYGDSYSSAPGAGLEAMGTFNQDGKCKEGTNSWPRILTSLLPAQGPAARFPWTAACTGAKTQDIYDTSEEGRASQLSFLDPIKSIIRWGTVSTGGNDVGFSDVVLNCIMTPGTTDGCPQVKARALRELADPAFEAGLDRAYVGIPVARPDEERKYLLVVVGYAKFFAVQDTECDNKYLFWGNFLTVNARNNLNDMVDQMNARIRQIVEEQNALGGSIQYKFFDIDPIYEGHRFCEPAEDQRPGRDWKTNAWFLTVAGDDEDQDQQLVPQPLDPIDGETPIDLTTYGLTCNQTQFDGEETWGEQLWCFHSMAMLNPGFVDNPLDPDEKQDVDRAGTLVYPDWALKAMHPKSIGHRATANAVLEWLQTLPTYNS